MTEIILWTGVPIQSINDPQLESFTRSAGPGWNAREQIVSAKARRWRYGFRALIYNAGHARSFRSIMARLAGRENYLNVPVPPRAYELSRAEIGAVGSEPIPHGDDSYFSDGSGYSITSPSTVATVSTASGNRLQVLKASLGGVISAGVHFSIDGWLYLVTGYGDGTNADSWELQFRPTLRRPIAAGARVDFNPRFVGRLEGDLVPYLELDSEGVGYVDIGLVEAFDRS